MTKILDARGLNKSFGGVWALKDLNVDQAPGETLGMIGPNGSGKTTFINAVTGHLALDGGEVSLVGKTITGKKPHAIAQAGLIRTYQAVRVYAQLPVAENLRVAGLPHFRRLGLSDPLDGADDLLAKLSLKEKKRPWPARSRSLNSGGSKLAMRLISRPKLIMLDEPVGGSTRGRSGR